MDHSKIQAEARGTSIGFALDSTSSAIAVWLADIFPSSILLPNVKGIVYGLALVVWISTFAKPQTQPEVLPTTEALGWYINLYARALGNIRGQNK
jgi:hypothetical protein